MSDKRYIIPPVSDNFCIDFAEMPYDDLAKFCYDLRESTLEVGSFYVFNPNVPDFEIFINVLHAWFPEAFIYVDGRGEEFEVGIEVEELITWR